MNAHEFIVKNVRENLEKQGVSRGVAFIAAEEALEHYKRTAHFKKNAFEECMKFARKRAKEMVK